MNQALLFAPDNLRFGAGSLAADPPWQYEDQLPGDGRGASKHYVTMSTRDICSMDIPPVADDCWLWIWRLHTHQKDAFEVAEAWGFGTSPCSELVWVKQTKDGKKTAFGMGHSLRMAHEVCLLFKRGNPQRASAGVRSVIHAPRLEHSRKPDLFYETVEKFVGDVPKVELFARRRRENWLCFGNELPSEAEAAA